MKCSIKFTETAKQDLRDIAIYVAEQSGSKETAKKFVAELRKKCLILEDFPESGAIPHDRVLISSGYRFLVHGEYLLFYLYKSKDNTAYLTAVFNAKRDYFRVMKKYL